jgi:hypothetical protein
MKPILIFDDKIVKCTIGDTDYELLFSMYSLNKINKKFGGVANISKFLSGNNPDSIENILYLFEVFVNSANLYHNLKNPDNVRDVEFTDDFSNMLVFLSYKEIEIITVALTECINKGNSTIIQSNPSKKKVAGSLTKSTSQD